MLSLHCCSGFSLVAASGGYSVDAVSSLLIVMTVVSSLLIVMTAVSSLLIVMTSLDAEHGL